MPLFFTGKGFIMNWMDILKAFFVGGLICVAGQLLIDFTKLTPARILVLFVCSGVVLTALGVYEPVVEFAGAGATVPLVGFGYSLAKGVEAAVARDGLIGALNGGLVATATGISACVLLGFVLPLFAKSKDKS